LAVQLAQSFNPAKTLPQYARMIKQTSFHVAVLVDTATGWGRRLIRGVIRYSEEHGPWHLTVRPMGQRDYIALPRGWRGDGVIARVGSPRMVRELTPIGEAVVNISSIELPDNPFPCVTTDYHASATMAFEHFYDRGFRQFAYSGFDRFSYGRRHREAFREAVHAAGYRCHVHKPRRKPAGANRQDHLEADMIAWLRSLPTPVGVFSWGAYRGRDILEACREAEIAVPYEVAVLGGDYDDVLCEAATPSLSGMLVASEQIGYRAAKLCERLMRGGKPPKKHVLISPAGIVEKRSSDTLAISDPDVVEVMRFIRENAFRPIQMADILQAVPTSRRSIERKFTNQLGRTPSEEIRHLRMAKAKRLLAETNLSMPAVAEACGYGTYNYLTRVFKEEFGVSPSEFRMRTQGRK